MTLQTRLAGAATPITARHARIGGAATAVEKLWTRVSGAASLIHDWTAVVELLHNWRPSSIDGAGFQQAAAYSDPAAGHTPGLVISYADVAGFHLSTDDGATWKQCNKGLTELWHRKGVAVEFDRHNPDCVLAYFSNGTLTDSAAADDVGRRAGLLYGVIDAVAQTITWTVLVDGSVTAGPTYPATNLYPSAAEGANGTTARQTGRMIACDPFTANRWYVGTRQGVVTVTVTRTAGAATGATVNNLVRNGATDPRDMVTSVVVGPESTSTDTVLYFTVRAGGTNGGLNRKAGAGPGQSGAVTRLAGTNSPTTAIGAEGVSCETEGGVTVAYVAANAIFRKWTQTSGSTGTWTVADPHTNPSVRWHSVDTARIGAATRVVTCHYSVDGAFAKIAWSDNGGSTWNLVTKAKTTLLINGDGVRWWLPASAGYYRLSDAAGEGGWDGSQILFRPDDPAKCIASGRSGLWKTADITAGGTNWHPAVRGLCATVANFVGIDPTNPARVIVGDVDWASITTTDRYATEPALHEEQLASPSYQVSFNEVGAMARAQGDRDDNVNGGVVYNSAPFGGGSYVKLGGIGPGRCWGVALGRAGVGDATVTAIAAVEGVGLVRKAGMNTTANATTVNATAQPASGFRAPIVWPAGTGRVFAYIARQSGAAGGIWRSTNYGTSFTQVLAFTNTNRYASQLIVDPNNNNRLYFVRDSGGAGTTGVFRVDNASTTFDVTRILTLTQPGPIAMTAAGRLYAIAEPDDSQGSKLRFTDNPTAASPTWEDVDDAFLDGALGYAHHMAIGADNTIYVAKFDGGYLVGDPA